MAKIRESKNGRENGGYTRIFNNQELGSLFSRVQASVIRAGTELEKIVFNCNIENLDEFLTNADSNSLPDGQLFIADKKCVRNSNILRTDHQPDGVIFIITNRLCKIIELKDGDTFDTKKSDGELETLQKMKQIIGERTSFRAEYYLCSFNASTKEEIVKGLKGRFDLNNVMTGRELCSILNLNYQTIVDARKQDGEDNIDFFLDELLKINEIREKVINKLNQR